VRSNLAIRCGSFADNPGSQDCGAKGDKPDARYSGNVNHIQSPILSKKLHRVYWLAHIGDFGPP
jgi:hypothetical protein